MGDHINTDGEFQSDKYPWCRPGFVPLKITDPGAWRPLWDYAEQRRSIDAGFADDLQAALVGAGFMPPMEKIVIVPGSLADAARDKCFQALQTACAGHKVGTVFAALIDSLGVTIAYAVAERAQVESVLFNIGGDLAKAVDRNWQSVKDQAAAAHGRPGHG